MALSFKPGHLNRYREIALLLARHGRADLVRSAGIDDALTEESPGADPEAAARLADDLEAMGPTFVKLGQLLASRVDLLPPAYTEALSRLQDDVEPFPVEEVEEIIATELGVRLSRVFPTFESEPMAAASLGQVHRATLRDGRRVVVKVQRPGIRARIAEDMEVLAGIAETLDRHTEVGHRYAFADLFEQFRSSLVDELDYSREATDLDTLRRVLADQELVVVPAPVHDLTTSRVLTMEYVDGRNVTSLGPLGLLELDGARLADALFLSYLRQVLVEGVFHADPHPGNVLVTTDGRLALIDVGMVARIKPGLRERLVKLFLALADARPDEVARLARTMGEELPDFDEKRFDRAVADVVARTEDASMQELNIGVMVLQLTREAAECGLRMDPELVMLGKTLLNLGQVAATLDPGFEPREALRRHTSALMRSSMETSPASLMASVLEAKEFVEELPGRVNRAFDAIGSGRFELRVNAFDEDEFLRGLHKLANVGAAGIILAALILASALLARGSGSHPSAINWIAMVVFVISVVVGLSMLLSIWWRSRGVHSRR
ncbi:MAG TPA: AarF/UbiB family protein [Marmoricola sp.]|nr:AarF/UbiB family protein [Marmoricola sp.]